jgi:hypothetical protein
MTAEIEDRERRNGIIMRKDHAWGRPSGQESQEANEIALGSA